MMIFLKVFLLVINILMFVSGLIAAAFILMCEFIGYDKGNDLLENIKFPLSDNGLIGVGLICVILSILLYILRKKWFKAGLNPF